MADELVPRGNSKPYTVKAYWEKRFATEEHHEWLAAYKDVKCVLDEILTDKNAKILLVGCGNSTLAADMADDGYTHLVSTDYSGTVIAKMSEKYASTHPQIQWEVQDMTALTYPESSFDVVLDKAAMDAVMAHGADVWDPPVELLAVGEMICGETARVLKPNGQYLQITFSQPHFRKQYLTQREGRWSNFKKYDIAVGFGYFLFQFIKA